MTTQLAAPPLAAPANTSALPPLIHYLERTATSFLEPAAFFVSWQGVLTLAYSGFTEALVDLKQRISAAHPSLPSENPGSKWPKTSLGCLLDGKRLTPDQLALLCAICKEESRAFQQLQGDGNNDGLKLSVDSACVALYECRSLEKLLACQHVVFEGGVDASGPSTQEQARVASILAEPEAPDYWFAASRDGNREAHYRGQQLGATLMHPLALWAHGEADEAAAHVARPGLQQRGVRELDDRRALLAAVERFRREVDAALPGLYAWFSDASLHITLRALIN